VQVGFTTSSHSPREAAAFFEHVLASVRTMPGVQSASLATGAPLHEMSLMPVRTTPGGDVVRIANGLPMGNRVSDDFFESIGLQLVSGRAIAAEDRTGPPVVVVNEALARLAWPGRSPLGECAYVGSDATSCARVVGVARNTHTARIRESQQLAVFASLPLEATDDRVLLVRVAPGARGVDATVGRALRELDPTVLYVDAEWLGDALAPELRPWRLGAAVFTAFGILAALLAALGLYTAMAYAVAQRTRELGVRAAMGARAASIVRLVFGDALRVTAAGIVAGLAIALVGGRWIGGLLFDTSARDPLVFAAVAAALLLASLAAGLAPARRAARVSPMEAMRGE